MFRKIVKSIQDWSEQNQEKADAIVDWVDSKEDSIGFRVVNAVAEAGLATWVALGRPGAGGETESQRLYNLAYNAGLKGHERTAAIQAYLEYEE